MERTMQFQNLVILLGYKKDKLAETRLINKDDAPKQLVYMAEYIVGCTTIEELRVQSNGTTVYWQTHRVSDLIPNKD
jgi:hypothetical protein